MSNQDAPQNFDERIKERQAHTRIALDTIPDANPHQGAIPNTPLAAAVISFLLGGVFFLGATTFAVGGFDYWWTTYQLGFFFAAWSAFHWAEFAVTAGWNREKCSVDSFLLENGSMYHIAHSIALFEYLVTLYFKPELKAHRYASTVGVAVVFVGQLLRSSAMIHASTNFSHSVAWKKRDAHRLVTTGVYAWSRHPSYAGFFYWALGTQIVLQNYATFVVFAILLWRFFSARTKGEEVYLVKFFGDEYVQYRKRVGTKIPFV